MGNKNRSSWKKIKKYLLIFLVTRTGELQFRVQAGFVTRTGELLFIQSTGMSCHHLHHFGGWSKCVIKVNHSESHATREQRTTQYKNNQLMYLPTSYQSLRTAQYKNDQLMYMPTTYKLPITENKEQHCIKTINEHEYTLTIIENREQCCIKAID